MDAEGGKRSAMNDKRDKPREDKKVEPLIAENFKKD